MDTLQHHRERLARLQHLFVLSESLTTSGDETGELKRAGVSVDRIRDEVRHLSLQGIPDYPPSIRPTAYRHLLNLSSSSKLLSHYSAFVDEVGTRIAALPPPAHGLGEKELKEDRLLREIERDVDRTFGGLSFFGAPPGEGVEAGEEDAFWKRLSLLEQHDQQNAQKLASGDGSPSISESVDLVAPPSLSLQPPEETGEQDSVPTIPVTPTSPTRSPFSSDLPTVRPRTRRQSLLRPLYLWASLNPGLGYVQGMNSIAAVFLWIFSSSATPLEAEASTFFALGAILAQMRDLFVASLDGTITPTPASPSLTAVGAAPSHGTPTGLGATLTRYSSLLNWLDPTVASSLDKKGVDPALYVFRWLTTLFANEFALPDLVRIWDRVIALYPADAQGDEALSPLLGHLIDLSLAIVLVERPVIISPYSTFQRTIAVLHDPQIEGEQVDLLLKSAWDIRDRRLGRNNKRGSMDSNASTGSNWRSAANRWSSAAKEAAAAASSSSTASSLKSRFWSTPTKQSGNTLSTPSSNALSASDYDLDDAASVAESETSVGPGGSPMFASRGQRLGVPDSSRLSHGAEPVVVDGKVLPPPPDVVDERERTLGKLPPPPAIDGENESEDEYGDPEPGLSLKDRAVSSWGDWRNRLAASDAAASLSKATTNLSIAASQSSARFGSSDAAASIAKTTTNLSIQAQLLKDQVASQGPERLAQIKENVAVVSGRLLASTGSEAGGGSIRRPGSPVQEPFTPPSKWGDSPGTSRRPVSPAPFSTTDAFSATPGQSFEMARGGSGGPKPLLLSTSARPAADRSSQDGSPPGSRRDSLLRSPSPSRSPSSAFSERNLPQLFSTAPVPVLGRSHSRTSSHTFASPSPRATTASTFHLRSVSAATSPHGGMEADEDVPIQSVRLQDESAGARLRRAAPRRETTSESAAVPAANGRGWTLSDGPVKAPPERLTVDTTLGKSVRPGTLFASPAHSDIEGDATGLTSPEKGELDKSTHSHRSFTIAPDSSFAATAINLPWSPDSVVSDAELPPPIGDPTAPSPVIGHPGFSRESSTATIRPPRTSSAAAAVPPPRTTSSTVDADSRSSSPDITSPTSAIRRSAPVGRRRLGRSVGSQGSISSFSELDPDRRKSLSTFLTGDVGDDSKSMSSSVSGTSSTPARKKEGRYRMSRSWTTPPPASPTPSGGGPASPSPSSRPQSGDWDEATDILNAYGD